MPLKDFRFLQSGRIKCTGVRSRRRYCSQRRTKVLCYGMSTQPPHTRYCYCVLDQELIGKLCTVGTLNIQTGLLERLSSLVSELLLEVELQS